MNCHCNDKTTIRLSYFAMDIPILLRRHLTNSDTTKKASYQLRYYKESILSIPILLRWHLTIEPHRPTHPLRLSTNLTEMAFIMCHLSLNMYFYHLHKTKIHDIENWISIHIITIPSLVWTNMVLSWMFTASIPAWIINYTHYNVWDEITYPFLNLNGTTVEV